MKARTKIILSVSTVFVLIFLYGVWLLAPRGPYYFAEEYDFHVDDSCFVNALLSIKKKHPNLVMDSTKYLHINLYPDKSTWFYGEFIFRSKVYQKLYVINFRTRYLRDTITTVSFFGILYNENSVLYRINDNLDDEESEKYIQDFETSILPLLEKELGMKAEFQD